MNVKPHEDELNEDVEKQAFQPFVALKKTHTDNTTRFYAKHMLSVCNYHQEYRDAEL